jgi:hypothetical protein
MLKERAGQSAELSHPANREHMEQERCELVREVCQILETCGLEKFTYALITSLCIVLNDVIHELERLPETRFKELIEVIAGLAEARNELRLSRFLFEVEEINPVYRLILRNRAVMRGKHILQRMLFVWPIDPAPGGESSQGW